MKKFKGSYLSLFFTLLSLIVFKPAAAQDWNKELSYNVIMSYWNWFPDYLVGKTLYPIQENSFLEEYGFFLSKTPGELDLSYTGKGYTSNYDLVIKRTFKIISYKNVINAAGINGRYYLLEDDLGKQSYLDENMLVAFTVDGLNLEDVNVCSLIEKKEDKFTKEVTYFSPITSSNRFRAADIIALKNDSEYTSLFLKTFRGLRRDALKGVYLLLENEAVISDEEAEVKTDVDDMRGQYAKYGYEASILLNASEVRYIVNNPITDYRIGNIDTEMDFPEFWSEILRCMNN